MEVKESFIKAGQIVFVIVLIVSIALNVWLLTKENEYKVVEKVVTKEVRDTIRDTVPKLVYETRIRVRRDTLLLVDTVPGDTVHMVVEVPVTQKEYSDDSTYTAWVSGYKPNLDSINIYRKTNFIEREITKTKRQRFVIGPQVGYGYDFAGKKFGPTVGVGVTYNLFGF